MQLEDSKLLLRAGLDASNILNAALNSIRPRLDEADSQALARRVGHVLAEINERVFDPEFVAYPELQPGDSLEGWRRMAANVGAADWSTWPDNR
jgi:hypothetical protein